MIPADLPLEFVRVVERAAIEAARTMGRGDPKGADGVAYASVPTTYGALPEGRLSPGQVAILFLSSLDSGDMFYVGCPPGVTPAVRSLKPGFIWLMRRVSAPA